MAEKTGISWTDHTFNPWWGCTKVSPGCKNCYAETFAERYGFKVWGPGKLRRTFRTHHWTRPLAWNHAAELAGERRRVFCASMADVFDEEAPAGELARLWALIRVTPWLDWLLLTKRSERIAESLPADWGAGYPNVWLGVSVESAEYMYRVQDLALIPAVVRFLSVEPLLEDIAADLQPWLWAAGDERAAVDWVIVGGESGAGRRPFDIEWARSIQLECAAGGPPNVAFWFKQVGAFKPGQGEDALGRVYHELPTPAVLA